MLFSFSSRTSTLPLLPSLSPQNADGKLDEHDVKIATSRVYKVLVHQVPSAAGFGAGLWFGLRS